MSNRSLNLLPSAERTASEASVAQSTPDCKGAHVVLDVSAVDDVESVGLATVTQGLGTAEVQTITVDAGGGTFTITWNGQTTSALAFDVSAADLETALDGLSNIADGDVEVTGGPGDVGGTTPYTLTWLARLGNVASPTTDPALLTGGAGTATVGVTTPGTGPTNEVQTVTVSADGGTFTLTFDGQTTSALAYNVSAADMQTALRALSNIDADGVTVSGGPGDIGGTAPYTVTFVAGQGGTNVAQMTANGASLTLAASVVPHIQAQNPTSGDWYDVLVGDPITATGVSVLKVYPGLPGEDNAIANDVLPATWRLSVVASDTTPVTYSASAWVVP